MSSSNQPVGVIEAPAHSVRFDLPVGDKWQTFRVEREALEDVAHIEDVTKDGNDPVSVFNAHQAQFVEIARRLIAVGASGDEVLIHHKLLG